MNRKANIFVQSYVLDAVKAKQYKLPVIIGGKCTHRGPAMQGTQELPCE